MAKTYLQLTNEVLRVFNQVELTSVNFDDARGVHSWAKDGVNMAIRQINTEAIKWPFNYETYTQTLTAGTYEYSFPSDFKTADWNSFQIQEDTDLGVSYKTLGIMDRDEWYTRHRDLDDAGTVDNEGRNVPHFVVRSHGGKYVLTPNPNQAYELTYKYYKYSTELSLHSDTTTIPDQFAHVIVLGASKHLSRMMDGLPYSQDLGKEFDRALGTMRTILINDEEYLRDTRVNY